jgi:Ala-tRNA(Pro) deacylase
MLAAETQLFADLQRLGIAYEIVEHEAVFTVEESRQIAGNIPGADTKNLFLKDSNDRLFLVTVPADKRVDLKKLPSVIGSGKLSFGKQDVLWTKLRIRPGSVTPLAVINDREQQVTVVVDDAFCAAVTVNVHPLRNTATLMLRLVDMIELLSDWGHDVLVREIPSQPGLT